MQKCRRKRGHRRKKPLLCFYQPHSPEQKKDCSHLHLCQGWRCAWNQRSPCQAEDAQFIPIPQELSFTIFNATRSGVWDQQMFDTNAWPEPQWLACPWRAPAMIDLGCMAIVQWGSLPSSLVTKGTQLSQDFGNTNSWRLMIRATGQEKL